MRPRPAWHPAPVDADHLIPWPEDPVPHDVPAADLAVLAEQGGRPVWGEGCPGAPLMVVLDNPGLREDRDGRPFVCGTRQTLRIVLRAAGVGADEVYVTWVLKRRPVRAYDRESAWARSLPLLRRQISDHRPRVLLCAGDKVARALLGPEASVKALRGHVREVEGLPAVFTYHPLAARRRPNLLPLLTEDTAMAARLIRPG